MSAKNCAQVVENKGQIEFGIEIAPLARRLPNPKSLKTQDMTRFGLDLLFNAVLNRNPLPAMIRASNWNVTCSPSSRRAVSNR